MPGHQEHLPHDTPWEAGFERVRAYVDLEWGHAYLAERAGCFCVIEDRAMQASQLEEHDPERSELVVVTCFDTAGERAAFLEERGWIERHRKLREYFPDRYPD